MGRGKDVAPVTGWAECDAMIDECRDWLAERGELIVGSGSFRAGPLAGSLHCDLGPPGQDKPINQDYALAWVSDGTDKYGPRLVLALADGLTNSYRSECAAALACWNAACTVAAMRIRGTTSALAQHAFHVAGVRLAKLAEEWSRDPEASCPEDQFPSTWRYILKKGSILQTTLTLAWFDAERERVHIAMLGDGGVLWRERADDAEQAADRVLAACDLESQQVNALGPANKDVQQFDLWYEQATDSPFHCALFTDGIGRGIAAAPFAMLDELESLQTARAENPARQFIERAIGARPRDFDDNVTLAAIQWTSSR